MIIGGAGQALPDYHLLGWVSVAVGALVLLWGVRINDRPWWQRKPVVLPDELPDGTIDPSLSVPTRKAVPKALAGIGASLQRALREIEEEDEARRQGRLERLRRGDDDPS